MYMCVYVYIHMHRVLSHQTPSTNSLQIVLYVQKLIWKMILTNVKQILFAWIFLSKRTNSIAEFNT